MKKCNFKIKSFRKPEDPNRSIHRCALTGGQCPGEEDCILFQIYARTY